MLHLTIGIDTESDNQWSTASRLDPTYTNIYALPRLDELFQQCETPTDVPHYVSGRDRAAIGRDDAPARTSRPLRNWRASSRVGNASVRCRRGARVAVRAAHSARQIRAAGCEPYRGDREDRGIFTGIVSIGPDTDLTPRTQPCSKRQAISWTRASTRCCMTRIAAALISWTRH